jgi:hypothetical protein
MTDRKAWVFPTDRDNACKGTILPLKFCEDAQDTNNQNANGLECNFFMKNQNRNTWHAGNPSLRLIAKSIQKFLSDRNLETK